MNFTVKKLAPELVGPSEPTPLHTLPLSFMDRLPSMRFFLELILVFRHGSNYDPAAKAIREALPVSLVAYYPVAGRIIDSPNSSSPEVKCSDDGVLFVEAYVDCCLKDIDHLDTPPLMIHKDQLLPSLPQESNQDGIIFLMQVTQFKCGGFTVGIKFNHTIFDGIGAAQFIKAVSEKARGLVEPTIKPIWCRDLIPSPLNPTKQLRTSATFKFERHVADVSLICINQLKQKFMIETGQKCSAFEVVAAMIWQCRTRAIKLDPHVEATLRFPANVRQAIKQFVTQAADGYYGNCIHHVIIQAPSEQIADGPLTEIVRLIQEAKRGLSEKFLRWMDGDSSEDPPEPAQAYSLLDLSDWRRLGFFEVDYGWGVPMRVVPTNEGVRVGSCIFLKPPEPGSGVRLMTHCVVKEHLQAFCMEMLKWGKFYM